MPKTSHVHVVRVKDGWLMECERCKRQTMFSDEQIAREVAVAHKCHGRG